MNSPMVIYQKQMKSGDFSKRKKYKKKRRNLKAEKE